MHPSHQTPPRPTNTSIPSTIAIDHRRHHSHPDMNHYFFIVAFAAIILKAITASAFLPTITLQETSRSSSSSSSSWTSSPRSPSTYLQSLQDNDRIKKAGAGVATTPPGNLCLYDPNDSGKLQGSSNLMERLQSGASFGRGGVGGAMLSTEENDEEFPSANSKSEASPKKITTNLTKVLGEMDSRMRGQGRSQY